MRLWIVWIMSVPGLPLEVTVPGHTLQCLGTNFRPLTHCGTMAQVACQLNTTSKARENCDVYQ